MALDVDTILLHLGGYGRFQMLTFLYIGLICMRGVWHLFGISFLAAIPGHHCNVPLGTAQYHSRDSTGHLVIDQCHQYTNFSLNNATAKCSNGWEYESHGSLVDQWDLVCDRAYLADLSTSIFMGGVMFGGFLLTPLADYFGRKWVVIVSLLLQGVLGSIAAFVNNFIVFVVLRFCIGALNQVVALVAYVALTEAFPPSHRTKPGIALQFFWAVGICILALFAWLMPNWRHLQLAISVPNILAVCLIWLFQESIPWYVMKGKYKQAERALNRIAVINRKTLPVNCLTNASLQTSSLCHHGHGSCSQRFSSHVPSGQLEVNMPLVTEEIEQSKLTSAITKACDVNSKPVERTMVDEDRVYTTFDLFRYPRLRTYTLAMFLIWFINSLDYYGISLSVPSLHGNVYINVLISGLVEVPAYLVVMFALDKFGRRRPLALFAFVSGIANLATAFMPKETRDGTDLRTLITVMAMIGKFAITGSFCTVFLFAAEIFPTVLRNAGIGFVSLGDSIGGVVAPLILLTSREHPELPRAIFGVLAILSAVAVLVLPETTNRPLLETVEDVETYDGESIGQHVRDFFKCSCRSKSRSPD